MTATAPNDAARIARGRLIVLAAVGLTLLIMAANFAIAVMADTLKPGIFAIRVALACLLLWAMYRGRAWARLLFLILLMVAMAFWGAIAIEPPELNTEGARIFSLAAIAISAVLVGFLSFDKRVVHYEQAQRARFPRLFGPEAPRAH